MGGALHQLSPKKAARASLPNTFPSRRRWQAATFRYVHNLLCTVVSPTYDAFWFPMRGVHFLQDMLSLLFPQDFIQSMVKLQDLSTKQDPSTSVLYSIFCLLRYNVRGGQLSKCSEDVIFLMQIMFD